MDDEWRRRKDETRNILDAMVQIPKWSFRLICFLINEYNHRLLSNQSIL
jgi:hypothetical protein